MKCNCLESYLFEMTFFIGFVLKFVIGHSPNEQRSHYHWHDDEDRKKQSQLAYSFRVSSDGKIVHLALAVVIWPEADGTCTTKQRT